MIEPQSEEVVAAISYLEHKYCLHCGKSLNRELMRRKRYRRLGIAILCVAGAVAFCKAMGWW